MNTITIHNDNFFVHENMVSDGKFNIDMPDIVLFSFEIISTGLTTLIGGPKEVLGSYTCSYNELTSLEGVAETVMYNFNCSKNKLTNLIHSPKYVGRNYTCSYNPLTSLEGVVKNIKGKFACAYTNITNLKHLEYVKMQLIVHTNKINCLKDMPKCNNIINIAENCINTLKDLKPSELMVRVDKELVFERDFIMSNEITDYHTDLFNYCKKNSYPTTNVPYWPEEFINSLNDEDKEYFKSSIGINKFDL